MLTVEARNGEKTSSEFSFELASNITTMILPNNSFRINLFRITSFDSWVCLVGEPRKKKCWLSQQRTEKSIFIAIFRNGFDVINAMILKNTIFRFCWIIFCTAWRSCILLCLLQNTIFRFCWIIFCTAWQSCLFSSLSSAKNYSQILLNYFLYCLAKLSSFFFVFCFVMQPHCYDQGSHCALVPASWLAALEAEYDWWIRPATADIRLIRRRIWRILKRRISATAGRIYPKIRTPPPPLSAGGYPRISAGGSAPLQAWWWVK